MSKISNSTVRNFCDREVTCSTSGRLGLNLEPCVWRAVPSDSSHYPQKIRLARFSPHVQKVNLKPHKFILHHCTEFDMLNTELS